MTAEEASAISKAGSAPAYSGEIEESAGMLAAAKEAVGGAAASVAAGARTGAVAASAAAIATAVRSGGASAVVEATRAMLAMDMHDFARQGSCWFAPPG